MMVLDYRRRKNVKNINLGLPANGVSELEFIFAFYVQSENSNFSEYSVGTSVFCCMRLGAGGAGVLQHPLEKIRGCAAPPATFLLTIYKVLGWYSERVLSVF